MRLSTRSSTRLAAALGILAGAGCGGSAAAPFALPSSHGAIASPIEHVVFIIQENRSFNNLFLGYPGATTQSFGYDTKGRKIALQPIRLATNWDVGHSSTDFFAACNGKGRLPGTDCRMDGWNNEVAAPHPPPNYAYAYVPRKEIEPYWALAREYVLADRTFASNLDASFVAHQYALAAYAARTVDYPYNQWGCQGNRNDTIKTFTQQRTYGPKVRVCFGFPTLADEADGAAITWRSYAGSISGDGGLWSPFQADRHIFEGPDWNANVVSPPSEFLTDVANGKLANITWISPTYETSDHPGLRARQGPAWVASVVNAIGESKFWDSTAVFVFWDDWGGWFDPVRPVYEDYDGLGFRVPLLMVSPYAKRGYVTHARYETASVLRFIEDNFGLAPLAASDARAHDPVADAFDYRQKPRKFKTIPGAKPAGFWLRAQHHGEAPASNVIGDD
ncbi:MAG TPA: alkaline phosphatase family protein [Candidatus Nitrosotalea sp.]|nr:alkaline phosphatase family protein [Candidatus Nitrosotalea sp.]